MQSKLNLLSALLLSSLLLCVESAPAPSSPLVLGESVNDSYVFKSLLCFVVSVVPGILGNQIEGKLNRTSEPHFFCPKKKDWFTMWLSIEQLLPGEIDCLSENMR